MTRKMIVATAILMFAGVANAGNLKVTSKSLKSADIPHLSAKVDFLEKDIMREKDKHFDPAHPGSTPAFLVAAHGAVKLTAVREFNEADQYNVNAGAAFRVSELAADNVLKLTALIPVSGHVGNGPARVPGKKIGKWEILSNKNESAAEFAATNHYNLEITHLESGDVHRITNIASTGLVTPHEVAIEMAKPGTYRLQVWPDGSAGVGGYAAGRTIDLVRP